MDDILRVSPVPGLLDRRSAPEEPEGGGKARHISLDALRRGLTGERSVSPLPPALFLAVSALMGAAAIVGTVYQGSYAVTADGVSLGAVIMVVGYSLGRAFVYSTPEYAILKLPFQILQAAVGAVCGIVICFPCRLSKLWDQWRQSCSI